MKRLGTFIVLLILSTCQHNKKKNDISSDEYFYCSTEEIQGRHFFKRMRNIEYFKNLRTGEFEKRKISISNNREFDTIFEDYVYPTVFETDRFYSPDEQYFNKIFFKKDSVFLFDNRRIFNLLSFNKDYKDNCHSCNIDLIKRYYDKKCKDTVYVFGYFFYPVESHSKIDSTGLREIWASRERGILKVVYKDSIGDLWEGKYYPELDENN